MDEDPATEQLAPAALLAAAPQPVVERVGRRLLHRGRPPKPAAGIELLGPMEGSGFEQTPYLVRRPDGQIVQLPELLYLVLEGVARQRTYGSIAEDVSQRFGAGIDADDARFLIDKKLKPLGLVGRSRRHGPVVEPSGDQPKPGDDLLALTWKAKLVPESAVKPITTLFKPLFLPPVVILLVLAFVAGEAWFFGVHGVTQTVRTMLYDPALLVFVFAGVIAATAFHEIGHATACRYGGARPGVLGIGLYVIWPVFYTDVTDAYRLGRGGRLRTDLGGIYFNSIVALACFGAYFATHWEPVLLLVMVQTFTIVQQLLPLGRLDGYLILTDLTGVPDLLSRMKPILRSLLPGRRGEDGVRDLKPWVRRVASGYMALLIPILLFIVAMMLINAPRVFATGYDSIGLRWDQTSQAFGHGKVVLGMGDLLQCAALVLPAVGMVVSTARIGKRLGGAAMAWSAGAPLRRMAVLATAASTVGGIGYTWLPNGDYRPIQPNERGTIAGAFQELKALPGGRASLTAQRALQLHGAPTAQSLLKRHLPNPNAPAQKGRLPGSVGRPSPGSMNSNGNKTPKAVGPTTLTGPNRSSRRSGTGTTNIGAWPTGTSTTPTTTGTGTSTSTGTGTTTTPTTTDTGTTTSPTGTSTTPTTTSTSTTTTPTGTTPTSTGTSTSTTPTTTTATTTSTTPTGTTTTTP